MSYHSGYCEDNATYHSCYLRRDNTTPSTRVHFGLLMAGYVRYFRASMYDRPDMELIIPVTAG